VKCHHLLLLKNEALRGDLAGRKGDLREDLEVDHRKDLSKVRPMEGQERGVVQVLERVVLREL
jgi:hypothetical protein